MYKGDALRALVNERLAAAAEEIFVLFERSISEFEEELRAKEATLRTLDSPPPATSPALPPPGPSLDQDYPDSAQIKGEPEEPEEPEELEEFEGVKQEEEQLPVFVPEASTSCMKAKESSLIQQRQIEEYGAETHGEDIYSATGGHFEASETDYNNDWGPPIYCSTAPLETEAGVDYYNTELSLQITPAPETSAAVQSGSMSGPSQGAEGKKHQCSQCTKRFWSKQDLQRHTRVHTGERPYSCSICQKTFALKGALNVHKRRHTDKPCYCPICNKEFTNSCNLKRHIRTHTGEKPYSCSFCRKDFNQSSNLKRHMRIHIEEKAVLNTQWLRDVSYLRAPF